jgi:capsular exopolysaccharide synthesis family protein
VPESYSERSEHGDVPGLVRSLQVLRERWWVVVICAAVSLAAAVIYLQRQPKQYTATAALQFTTNSLPSQVAGISSNQSQDPEGEKSTNLQLVTTEQVAALVINELRLKTTPASLLGQVSASSPHNDYIVNVSAIEQNPKEAAEIANAFARQYVVYSQEQNENQLIKGEQLINQHLARLPATDTTDRANLSALFQKLLLLQAVQTANARVAATAATPTSPTSPKKKSTAAVALVVGTLLGIGLAFLLNLLDRRVKSWEEFKELYGFPELASIPRLPSKPRTAAEREIALEPFRILHNSLSLLTPGHPVKTVLVTSAVAGEGKTTVACGLARVAALSGREVILVEADLRHPSLKQQLPLDEHAPGLASVLFDRGDPLELLQSPIRELNRLMVLPAGPVPKNATNLLRSDIMVETIASLSDRAHLVVIDSAPLLPVADTRVLLDELSVDACLVVARAGTTKREEARRARSVFDQRRLLSVGLVINGLTEVAGGSYYGDARTQTGVGLDQPELVDLAADSH